MTSQSTNVSPKANFDTISSLLAAADRYNRQARLHNKLAQQATENSRKITNMVDLALEEMDKSGSLGAEMARVLIEVATEIIDTKDFV